jgi:hypothetical protein
VLAALRNEHAEVLIGFGGNLHALKTE